MLHVQVQKSADALLLRFEGRFTGHAAENTFTLVTRCTECMALVVDLNEVTFVDAMGETVLAFFGRLGAEFIAHTAYTRDVCERLNLRLASGKGSRTDPALPSVPTGAGCKDPQGRE